MATIPDVETMLKVAIKDMWDEDMWLAVMRSDHFKLEKDIVLSGQFFQRVINQHWLEPAKLFLAHPCSEVSALNYFELAFNMAYETHLTQELVDGCCSTIRLLNADGRIDINKWQVDMFSSSYDTIIQKMEPGKYGQNVLRALLENPNLDLNAVDPIFKKTALEKCLRARKVGFVKLLLADPRLDLSLVPYPYHLAIHGVTHLSDGADERDCIAVIDLLVSDGRADINASKPFDDGTPISVLAESLRTRVPSSVLAALLRHPNANVNSYCPPLDGEEGGASITLLQMAAIDTEKIQFQMFLDHPQIDVKQTSSDGMSFVQALTRLMAVWCIDSIDCECDYWLDVGLENAKLYLQREAQRVVRQRVRLNAYITAKSHVYIEENVVRAELFPWVGQSVLDQDDINYLLQFDSSVLQESSSRKLCEWRQSLGSLCKTFIRKFGTKEDFSFPEIQQTKPVDSWPADGQ